MKTYRYTETVSESREYIIQREDSDAPFTDVEDAIAFVGSAEYQKTIKQTSRLKSTMIEEAHLYDEDGNEIGGWEA